MSQPACRRENVTDGAARRISFDETRCQGEPAHQHSMKVLISAMLGSVKGEVLLTIREGNHVGKYDSLEAVFRSHPTQFVLAHGAR
jgi:hypothetical protein